MSEPPPGSVPTTQALSSTAKLAAERDKKRIALKAKNLDVWAKGAKLPAGSLDSNMKKNTGFIKKVRQGLTADAKAQLVKEAATLNLDKYVEELVQAVPEGLAKCTTAKDSVAALEIVSELHARFAPDVFAIPLSTTLATTLAPPIKTHLQSIPAEQKEREESARIIRQKTIIRVVADVAVCEVIRSQSKTKPGESSSAESPGQLWLYNVLRDLLSTDREHANVPILITLLKSLGSHLVGPANQPQSAEISATEGDVVQQDALVPDAMAARFRKLCETYFATLSKRIVKEHERLQDQDRRNHEAYIRSGEIFEDRQQNYEKMAKSAEKVLESGKALSELLGLPMPALPDASKQSSNGLGVNLDARSSLRGDQSDEAFATGKSPWEDEETRRFYEDLIDLRDMIPPALLGILQPAAAGPDDAKAMGETSAATSTVVSPVVSPVASPTLSNKSLDHKRPAAAPNAGDGPSAAAPADEQLSAGPAAQLSALIARLPEMTNKSLIDSAAVEFALMNSKAARKRLVKQLAALPRNRSDLIPYYSRLIATLNPYMPDIGKGVLDVLDEEFRYLQRKRAGEVGETRAKNARFIGELAKFKVTPSHVIFHSFKVLLDDFSGPNIETLAVLLESCGRYLLRTEDSRERMRSLLEMLRRKRAAQNLDHRQLLLLDNAYYQCDPPERKTVEAKRRSPMELFIRHLVYTELNARSADKVLGLVRKMHWEDAETLTVLSEVFLRVWRVRMNNIHLLALLIADLQPAHPGFAVSIIDAVCENIRIGMEMNLFKHNQRRVALIQYLGELYVYRVVHSGLILDTLWSLITFGHPNGQALPGRVAPLDGPDDFFRIRLVCTLLDVCGVCFERASLRKKMDEFLIFFNLYIMSKEQPLPMDIDFMISDTLESVRPTFAFKRDWASAAQAADAVMTVQREKAAKKAARRAATMQATEVVAASGAGADRSLGHEAEEDNEDDDSSSDEDDQDEEGEANVDGAKRARQRGRRGEDEQEDRDEVDKSDEEGSASDLTSADEEEEEDDDDDLPRRAQQSKEELEAEEEFARELARMTTESGPTGGGSGGGGGTGASASHAGRVGSNHPSSGQRHLLETGVPFLRRGNVAKDSSQGRASAAEVEGQMRFQLLSKKGSKHQAHHLALPSDSAIATRTREMQIKELAERKQLKEYVLGYEGREEAEDKRSLEQALARQGIRLKHSGQGPEHHDQQQQRFL